MVQLRLTHKLSLACLALVVPTAGLAVSAFHESEELRATRGEELAQIAENVSDKIDRNLFERYGDVQAFGLNAIVQDRTLWYRRETPLVGTVDAYVDTYDVYALSLIVDLEGKVIAVNDKDASGKAVDTSAIWQQSFKGEAWFADAVAGRFTTHMPHAAKGNDQASGTVVVDAHYDALLKSVYRDREMAIGFAAPVKDDAGRPIAVWYNVMDAGVFGPMLEQEYAELATDIPSAHLTVLTGSGQVLLDHDPGHQRGFGSNDRAGLDRATEVERASASGKRVLAGDKGALEEQDGSKTDVVAGFAHSDGAMGFSGLDWSVVVRGDSREVLASATRSTRWVWVASLLSLAALIGVAWFVWRVLTAPIVAMTQAAKRLSEGDVAVSIDHKSGDELGELAEALRAVTTWIREVAGAAEAVSRGDLGRVIGKRSPADTLSESVIRVQTAVRSVDADCTKITDAVRKGDLAMRIESGKHEGAYAKLIDGLNQVVISAARPIGEAKDVLQRVAARDLGSRMAGQYEGDWDAIKQSLNQAVDNLEESLAQVSVAAEQVSTAAGEITIGNQSLAQVATEQASSLDSVTNRLQEVTTAGQQTAGNAQQARGMANAAHDAAERGASNMSGLSQAMEQIKSASDRTAQIVKTIDEIAFQTNLLALNAAVEAARAGDAGKGFAVVAEEVRNLAMRSAEAARSTSQMIEDAVKSAERGVTLNASVAKNFEDIRGQVGRVVEVMAEIAAAAETQAQGVGDINQMVGEMSRATQQNAATTEESASAAEELSGQAESLKELVGQFRLQHAAGAGGSSAKPRRALARHPAAPAPGPKGRVVHLRSLPPPRSPGASKGAQLIPFDDADGLSAMAEF